MNSGCIFNLYLKQWQRLIEGVEKVVCLLGVANKPSNISLRRFLYSVMAELFCFFIASVYELSKTMLGFFQTY